MLITPARAVNAAAPCYKSFDASRERTRPKKYLDSVEFFLQVVMLFDMQATAQLNHRVKMVPDLIAHFSGKVSAEPEPPRLP